MFVGLIELMLEFVKPITLSMRLFGNIYGGEVALAAITALTVAILPVALLGLEFMLNFIQALIFSILSLMFIVLATETHGGEEGELGHEAIESLEEGLGGGQPVAGLLEAGPGVRPELPQTVVGPWIRTLGHGHRPFRGHVQPESRSAVTPGRGYRRPSSARTDPKARSTLQRLRRSSSCASAPALADRGHLCSRPPTFSGASG